MPLEEDPRAFASETAKEPGRGFLTFSYLLDGI